jgi:trypsin-like peptidase
VEAAKTIKARRAPALRAYPHVCGLGVGFKVKGGKRLPTLALRVYVTEKIPLARLKPADRLPRTVDGLPVDVIVRRPRIRMFDPYHPAPTHAIPYGVLLGGISVGVEGRGTGTLGGSMFENGSLLDVMLTNWHVACLEVDCNSGNALQPSEFDGQGRERRVGTVLRSVLDERVDCAILGLNGVAFLERTVLDVGPLGIVAPAELGMAVQKSGRTSGLTLGTITDVDADVDVSNASGEGSVFHHTGQIDFEGDDGMVQRGDSGSLLLDMNGNVVGLVYAANEDGDEGDACHIQDVFNALDINVTAGMSQQDLIAATTGIFE